jgi:hypothetical protein
MLCPHSSQLHDNGTRQILDAVGDEPGNLPLSEFVLTELWGERRGSDVPFHYALVPDFMVSVAHRGLTSSPGREVLRCEHSALVVEQREQHDRSPVF